MKNQFFLYAIISIILFSLQFLTSCQQVVEPAAPATSEPESTTATPEDEPATEYDPWILTAEEAKEAVDIVLDMQSQFTQSPVPMPKPKMPSGAEIPVNGQAGTPELVEKDGVPAYEVPVLVNGKRVGEFYVKQRFKKAGTVEFIGGDLREATIPEWSGESY